jgi:hypothetical protein
VKTIYYARGLFLDSRGYTFYVYRANTARRRFTAENFGFFRVAANAIATAAGGWALPTHPVPPFSIHSVQVKGPQ